MALLISQQNTRNIKRWFNTPKWVGLCGLTSAFTLLFKHTPSNCYLAIIEEPLEPCDWYQSYGRKTGSPFAKSIHVWLWWIFNKTHTVFCIYMQKTILKLFVTHILRSLLFMIFFRTSLKASFLIMLHYLNIFFLLSYYIIQFSRYILDTKC